MTTYEPIVPRARIGFIIPSSNRMVEPHMTRYMPADVQPHFTRIGMTNRHKKPLDQLLPRIIEAADYLADSKCNVIVLQCTGTSMSGGVDMDRHIVAEIAKATKRPALSTAGALNAAFEALNARRIVFISETKQTDHDKKLAYLSEAGYDIVADKAASLDGTDAYCSAPPQFWYDTAMKLKSDAAEAYFLSCANIRATEVIEELERDLGKPVVTSNQAAIWASLRAGGLRDDVRGLGALLRLDMKSQSAAA